jgi:hypothetical protein
MGNQPSAPPPPPLPPPPPPPKEDQLEEGDNLIPAKITAKARAKLIAELARAIEALYDLNDEVYDKIEHNARVVKIQESEIKRNASIAYKRKTTQLNVLYSDIEEKGDDDCEVIQLEIDKAKKEIVKIKTKQNRDGGVLSDQDILKLGELEGDIRSWNSKLNDRKHKTTKLLTAAEEKGEIELSDIRDNERSETRSLKYRQEDYVESLKAEITDEIASIIKKFAKKGVFIPPILIDKFKNIVLPTILLSYGINGRIRRRV